jgi:hypothetical protein
MKAIEKDVIAQYLLPAQSLYSLVCAAAAPGYSTAAMAVVSSACLVTWLLWPKRETELDKLQQRMATLENDFQELASSVSLRLS